MDIALLRDARSRSISAENPRGQVGRGGTATTGTGQAAARDLGTGWKVSPSVVIEPGARLSVAQIDGPGVIRHLWRYLPRRDDLASTAWWYQDTAGGRPRVAPTLDQMETGSRP